MKNGKIVDLYPKDDSIERLCNQDVIDMLEEALEIAKKGKTINCAIISINKNSDSISYGVANSYLNITVVGALHKAINFILNGKD